MRIFFSYLIFLWQHTLIFYSIKIALLRKVLLRALNSLIFKAHIKKIIWKVPTKIHTDYTYKGNGCQHKDFLSNSYILSKNRGHNSLFATIVTLKDYEPSLNTSIILIRKKNAHTLEILRVNSQQEMSYGTYAPWPLPLT